MSKQGVVNIRGKEYKTVALRVQEFREQFKDYALVTDVIQLDQEQCVIKASVLNELNRVIATGIAQEFRKASQINGTSYVENCETAFFTFGPELQEKVREFANELKKSA